MNQNKGRMRKMLLSFLSAGLAFSLTLGGCSGEKEGKSSSSDTGSSQTASAVTAEPEGPAGNISGNAASYVVSTVRELKELAPAETKAIVILKGYYTPGDGGGGTFYYDSASRADENGGTVFKSAARGRFIRSYDPTKINVKWFGAKGDNSTDDTDAIQKAIDAVPKTGGTVTLPGGNYMISRTLQIGDGDAGQKVSSVGGIKLVGMGGGMAFDVPASTAIIATADMDSMISVNGRISDVEISGIYLGGNNFAKTGLYLHSFTGGYFHNLNIIGFRETGLHIQAGMEPTGNYNIYNRFESICVFCLNDNSKALLMDGHYTLSNDTWLSVFTDCRFDTVSTSGSYAAYFKFVDSISFYRCHFNCYNKASTGMAFDALDNNLFPSGIGFYDCSVSSTKVFEDETHHIRPEYFFGFGTEDGEQIPTHNKLIGVTDHGETFNMDDLDVFHAMEKKGKETTGDDTDTGDVMLLAKAGNVDTCVDGFPEKHHNVGTGTTVAVLVNTKQNLKSAAFYLSNYGGCKGSITCSVYRWNKDYKTTVKGSVLASDTVSDFVDNEFRTFSFTGLDTGYYLLVLTGKIPAGSTGVAVWTRKPVSTSITFVDGVKIDGGVRGSFQTE